MSELAPIEERVAKLEREVAALKLDKSLRKPSAEPKSWANEMSGSMKDFPEWGELVARGREIAEDTASRE